MHNIKTIIFSTVCIMSLTVSSNTETDLQAKILIKFGELTNNLDIEITSSDELLKLDKSDYILIDVRSKEEQEISMLPNAVTSINFEKNIKKFKGKKLIAYCTIGYRSGQFADKYKKLKIANLKDGLLAWSHNGGKFMKNGRETKKVHTYSKKWNFLNKNYQAVY